MINNVKPDERCVMAYVSSYYHAFSGAQQVSFIINARICMLSLQSSEFLSICLYTKFHSSKTTLLAVHNHIIRAMIQQQVTSFCLLDLTAAFDTIDHSILYNILNYHLYLMKLSHLKFTFTFHLSPSLLLAIASNLVPLIFSTVSFKVLGPLPIIHFL